MHYAYGASSISVLTNCLVIWSMSSGPPLIHMTSLTKLACLPATAVEQSPNNNGVNLSVV